MDATEYDVIVFGGGTAGRLMPWTMAKKANRYRREEVYRRFLSQCGMPGQQERDSHPFDGRHRPGFGSEGRSDVHYRLRRFVLQRQSRRVEPADVGDC
jgi:hypothetical protein